MQILQAQNKQNFKDLAEKKKSILIKNRGEFDDKLRDMMNKTQSEDEYDIYRSNPQLVKNMNFEEF